MAGFHWLLRRRGRWANERIATDRDAKTNARGIASIGLPFRREEASLVFSPLAHAARPRADGARNSRGRVYPEARRRPLLRGGRSDPSRFSGSERHSNTSLISRAIVVRPDPSNRARRLLVSPRVFTSFRALFSFSFFFFESQLKNKKTLLV